MPSQGFHFDKEHKSIFVKYLIVKMYIYKKMRKQNEAKYLLPKGHDPFGKRYSIR